MTIFKLLVESFFFFFRTKHHKRLKVVTIKVQWLDYSDLYPRPGSKCCRVIHRVVIYDKRDVCMLSIFIGGFVSIVILYQFINPLFKTDK